MGDAPGSFKAILKRGALVTAANWPVVFVQFTAESLFKLLLGVPIVGGIFLVALVVGHDVADLLRGDAREIVTNILGALTGQPAALVGFLVSMMIVLLGGSALMFILKAGTVATLAAAEHVAGPIERPPLRWMPFQQAYQFSPESYIAACQRFWRRYLRLGLFLLTIYALSAGLYLVAVVIGYSLLGPHDTIVWWWTLLAALASTVLIIWITFVNLVYLLIQMIVTTDDVSVNEASRRLLAFAKARGRHIAGVFLIVLALVLVATGASIVTTAALGLISFVPLVGLAVFPLQIAAWFVRGMLFQYLGLTALASYLTLYRGQQS
jgi:hypothetical protein